MVRVRVCGPKRLASSSASSPASVSTSSHNAAPKTATWSRKRSLKPVPNR